MNWHVIKSETVRTGDFLKSLKWNSLLLAVETNKIKMYQLLAWFQEAVPMFNRYMYVYTGCHNT